MAEFRGGGGGEPCVSLTADNGLNWCSFIVILQSYAFCHIVLQALMT